MASHLLTRFSMSISPLCHSCNWYEPNYQHCPWCGNFRPLQQIQIILWRTGIAWVFAFTLLLFLYEIPLPPAIFGAIGTWGSLTLITVPLLWATRLRHTMQGKVFYLAAQLQRLEKDHPITAAPEIATAIYTAHWEQTKRQLLALRYEQWANCLYRAIHQRKPFDQLKIEGDMLQQQHEIHFPQAEYLPDLTQQLAWISDHAYSHPTSFELRSHPS
mgnify:CR=1 FL=1